MTESSQNETIDLKNSINDIKKYCDDQMDTLYPEIKRNKMPHEYPVSGTVEYVDFKYDLINKTKKLVR